MHSCENVDPQMPPEDFRAGGAPGFPKECLCRLSDAGTEAKYVGNRLKKGGSVKHGFYCYINDLFWLCWEAALSSPNSLKAVARR